MTDVRPSNLVSRLRDPVSGPGKDKWHRPEALYQEAADEIERLRSALWHVRPLLPSVGVQTVDDALRGSPSETAARRSTEGLIFDGADDVRRPVDPILGTDKMITDGQLKMLVEMDTESLNHRAFVELWERRGSPLEPSGPPLYRHDWETLPGPSYRCKRCKTTCLDAHDALLCAVRPVKSKPRLRDSDAAFNLGVLPTEQPEKATEQLLADRDRLREVNKIALDKAQEALEGRSVEMDAAEKSALYGNIDQLTRKE